MAEMQTQTVNRKKRGIVKSKKLSTRVDLTPMVDLGFLLITFFIFTSALAKPNVMQLTMPDDSEVVATAGQSAEGKTVTLLLGKNNRLFYYFGFFSGVVTETSYKELRNVIIQKKRQILKKYGLGDMVVLIKASKDALYKNIVDSLDEMIINGISTYMLLDPEEKELEAIN